MQEPDSPNGGAGPANTNPPMKPMWTNNEQPHHMTLPNIRRSADVVAGYATAGSFLGSTPSVPNNH